jgi:hypothetical protein
MKEIVIPAPGAFQKVRHAGGSRHPESLENTGFRLSPE